RDLGHGPAWQEARAHRARGAGHHEHRLRRRRLEDALLHEPQPPGLGQRENPRYPRTGREEIDLRQADEKGPAARRRPKTAREGYFLYVEGAVEGANEADGPLSSACPFVLVDAHLGAEGHVDVAVRVDPAAVRRERIPARDHLPLRVHDADARREPTDTALADAEHSIAVDRDVERPA